MGAIKINGSTSGSTTITAPATGSDETIELSTALASKLDLAGGKILQIVRATDSTNRSTTSATFVDVTGMSVTITPQKSDSAIIIISAFEGYGFSSSTNSGVAEFAITDASDNPISGSQSVLVGHQNLTRSTGNGLVYAYNTLIAYATPATTSATTYKLRFKANTASTTAQLVNASATGQMYAIEVSA